MIRQGLLTNITLPTDAAGFRHTFAVLPPHPYDVADLGLSGSHAYGFNSADSDYDLRGIHIIPLDDLVGLTKSQETVERTFTYNGLSIDLVTHDIGKICRLLLKHNGSILEQVCGELRFYDASWHESLVAKALRTITTAIQRHYKGFAERQWRLCQTKPVVKCFLYLYRILFTAIHLLQSGEVEVNLATLNDNHFHLPHVRDLIARKAEGGEKDVLLDADMVFHKGQYRRLLELLQESADLSTLPVAVSEQAKHDLSAFLVDIRKNAGPRMPEAVVWSTQTDLPGTDQQRKTHFIRLEDVDNVNIAFSLQHFAADGRIVAEPYTARDYDYTQYDDGDDEDDDYPGGTYYEDDSDEEEDEESEEAAP